MITREVQCGPGILSMSGMCLWEWKHSENNALHFRVSKLLMPFYSFNLFFLLCLGEWRSLGGSGFQIVCVQNINYLGVNRYRTFAFKFLHGLGIIEILTLILKF